MADVALDGVLLEAYIGGAWVDLMPDVVLGDRISGRYGNFGFGPMDRVAGAGTMTFTLDNSAQNNAGKLGYYTPGHGNALVGWDINLRVRLVTSYSAGNLCICDEFLCDEATVGVTYYRFVGRIRTLTPTPGILGERRVQVECTDWMDDAARTNVELLATQVGVRSDNVIRAILAGMAVQPEATSLGVGQETFAYALDTDKDEKTAGLSVIQKTVISEFGYSYVRGDEYTGGVFVFENRNVRTLGLVSDYTFGEDELVGLTAVRSSDNLYNVIKATCYPRTVGAGLEQLFSMTTTVALAPGESRTIVGRYTDPSLLSSRISGVNMVAPVEGTDVNFSSNPAVDNGDLNGTFTCVATYGANSAEYLVTNTGAAGYITRLRARGNAIRIYDPIVALNTDPTSIAAYGEEPLTLDMPFQANPYTAYDFAVIVLAAYKDPMTTYSGAALMTQDDAALLQKMMTVDVGDRVDLSETMTALGGPFWVNGIAFELDEYLMPTISLTVTPASTDAYWLLEVVGNGELDATTVLGF